MGALQRVPTARSSKNRVSLRIRTQFLSVTAIAVLATFTAAAKADDDEPPASAAIIDKYLQAEHSHEDALRGASMDVTIEASIPKLKEEGRLRALRMISKVGQVTYRVLSFQGNNTVKNQVIARYLEAEQQGHSDEKLSITPANYKFKFKGQHTSDAGQNVYIFQLSPKKKRIGLFKGELWLDCSTYLPVFEKGRLVKSPSIFFKKVEFERAFAIRDGASIPQSITSTIDTRVIGKVQINISYSNFQPPSDTGGQQTSTGVNSNTSAPAEASDILRIKPFLEARN